MTQAGEGYYSLIFSLAAADASRFAALTGAVAGQPSPHDELAIIIAGRVIVHPVVTAAATTGQVQIAGLASRAEAAHLLGLLTGRPG